MKLTQETWLKKMEEKGIADEVYLILNGKKYTPRQIASMDYRFWLQVVKSI